MKVHLATAKENDLLTLMRLRGANSAHILTEEAADADLILFCGNPTHEPHLLLEHPLYRAYAEKCAVYSEDDEYLPLLPGVYCSARKDASCRSGRIFSWSYVSAGGRIANPYLGHVESQKSLLFSFQGGSTSMVRKRMYRLRFNRPDVLIEDTSNYWHWDMDQAGREERQQAYAATLAASHFVLCPRGAGTGSIRMFEVMQAGVAPVLIADDYPLPPHVRWDSFLLRVAERDIRRLPELLEPYLGESVERGRLARQAWLDHFAPEREFDAIVDLAGRALRHGPPSEARLRRWQSTIIFSSRIRRDIRSRARSAILWTLKWLRLKSPYRMNR